VPVLDAASPVPAAANGASARGRRRAKLRAVVR
jgi:hypothetical protein